MSVNEPIYHMHSSLNASRILHKNLERRMQIFTIVIYSFMFLLGITGNGLVIFVTGFRMKRTVNTVWFLSLAIADFTFTFFLLLNITNKVLDDWPFGTGMCKFLNTLTHLNLSASIYHLMIISLDRCISTLWPVWAQNHRTPQRAFVVACGVWILALLLSLPYLFFSKEISTPDGKRECHCVEGIIQTFTGRAMTISRFILTFVIPFGIIVVCYGAIVLKLRRSQLSPSNKPFKVIATVTVAFFVCWFPYHIFSFIGLKATENGHLNLVLAIGLPLAYSLAFINSCLNPILYAFMGYDFKQKLRHSLLAAFENAFAEDSAQNRGSTNIKSSASLELQ